MQFNVTVSEREAGMTLVAPAGSIDTTTSPVLETHVDAVLRGAPRVIVFDMSGVDYISSAGLRVIIKAKQILAPKGGKVMLVHLRPRVKRVFEIINALPPEAVFESVEEMDAYLDGIQRKI